MTRHSANEYPAVELVTSIQRRRWTLDEKLRIVEGSSLPGMSVSYVARKHGIAPSLLFRWRKLMSEGGRVIPPFLGGLKSRAYAASASCVPILHVSTYAGCSQSPG